VWWRLRILRLFAHAGTVVTVAAMKKSDGSHRRYRFAVISQLILPNLGKLLVLQRFMAYTLIGNHGLSWFVHPGQRISWLRLAPE
jgi:hypothetical protein